MDNKKTELQTLYTKHFNDVYRFAYFKLSNKEEAEDITSETFTKLMKEKDLNKILNKKAWLITVARNMVYNKYKSKEQVLKQVQDDNMEGGYQEFKEVGHKSLEEEVIDQELMEIIKKEIGKLDEISAEIIALKVWEELKFAEIAEITKLNESTVKLKYYRGIDKIKANIEGSNVKLRSFTLPILLAGIYQFGLVEMFKPEVEFVRNATKALFGAVNVSIIQKIMTKETVTATTGAAVGAGTVGAAASGGILATSLGKVLLGLGGALVVGTAGIAGVNLARQEQPKPTPIEEEKPVENEKPPEAIKETLKFSSKHFNWSFEYSKALGEVKSKYNSADSSEHLFCEREVLDFPNFDISLTMGTKRGDCEGGFGGFDQVDEQKLKTKDGKEFIISYEDQGVPNELRAMIRLNINSSTDPTAGKYIISSSRFDKSKLASVKENMKKIVTTMTVSDVNIDTKKFSSTHFNWSFEYNKILGEAKSKYEEASQPELQCKTEIIDFTNFEIDLRIVTGAGECVGGFGGENKIDEQKLKTKDGKEFMITYFDEGGKLRVMAFYDFNSTDNLLPRKAITIWNSLDKSRLKFVKQELARIITTMLVKDI